MTVAGETSATAGTSASPGASGARAASEPATGPSTAVALRAVALGVFYAALVLALLLLGRVGKGFIYQGF